MLNSAKLKPLIILLLLSLLITVGFGTAVAAANAGPELIIPDNIPAQANSIVNIPVTFLSHGEEITSIIFSIDYDQSWLQYDPTVSNAITFTNIPSEYTKSCSFDASDTDGEIDCNIIGFGSNVAPLTDGTFLTIKLRTLNASDGTVAPVLFSSDPPPSFGDSLGQSIAGTGDSGSVYFGEVNWFVFLPLLIKQTPVPTTVTPTPVTPTPVTPTPVTPTPVTPTPETPTPTPGCSNIILNGGFEEPGEAWYLPITNYPARFTSSLSYMGEMSMRTGINLADDVYSYSSAWQPVSIPNDAESADLTFYYRPQTSEPLAMRLLSNLVTTTNNLFEAGLGDPLNDQQMALILNEDTTHDRTLMSVLSNSRTWTASPVFDLMDYKGETIWVAFTTYNDGDGNKTAMYVDEVVWEVCR
jgi:hypothetical protein